VAAASGGLAVAGVAAGTIGLLAISGGFAAGSFAVVNNNALAFSYTVAANSIDEALKSARGQLVFVDRNDANKGSAPASCADALRTLITGVSNARTRLEVARTDNAAGALVRAKDQLNILSQQIATVEPVDITHVTLAADIVRVDPNKPKQAGQPTPVQITVKNVKLDQVGLGEVKIEFGQKQYLATAITKSESDDATYIVTFIAPVTPPDTGVQKYVPALILQGKARVQGKDGPNTVFAYP
jgi:hypothetical protein